MAITLTKEELLARLGKTTTATTTSSSFSWLDFLNNNAIQQIILRIADRIIPPINPQNPNPNPTTEKKMTGEQIYTMVLSILNSLTVNNPNMTVSQLKEEMEKNKESIVRLIENVVKSL